MPNNIKGLSAKKIGQYKIDDHIISTNICNIYTAHHQDDDNLVFLLVIRTPDEGEPELVGRFDRRINTLMQIQHPNIVSIQEYELTDSKQKYAILEYFKCRSLAELIKQKVADGKYFEVHDALILVRQIADVLSVAHPIGIIHHDLRPNNILIKDDNTPLLVDLSIPHSSTQMIKDSANLQNEDLDYASPEQLQGKALSGQSNTYSLGIILYELLAGHRPKLPLTDWDVFNRTLDNIPREIPLEEVRKDLSKNTYQLVKDCLWREEWNRLETINHMIVAIDLALEAERKKTEPTPFPLVGGQFPKNVLHSQRSRWIYLAIVIIAVLLTSTGFLLLFILSN